MIRLLKRQSDRLLVQPEPEQRQGAQRRFRGKRRIEGRGCLVCHETCRIASFPHGLLDTPQGRNHFAVRPRNHYVDRRRKPKPPRLAVISGLPQYDAVGSRDLIAMGCSDFRFH